MTYRKGAAYRFSFVGDRTEAVTYDGKDRSGMHRFVFATGEVWTGHTAPVTAEE